jgi:hypothetical protein
MISIDLTGENPLPLSSGLPPQDCQKKYPEYNELSKELIEVNKSLIEYRNTLGALAME